MGTPKALVHDPDGTSWLRRSVQVLADGGCDQVRVVLGAGTEKARSLLDGLSAEVVVADDWAEGMGVSLRAGLLDIGAADVLVTLVDLPDVGADVVARVRASGARLARATYDGRPGHPVLIGAEHLEALVLTLHGDAGARSYLETHDTLAVECGDLATGADRDTR